MDRQILINMGWEEIPHFTVGNNLIYNLGRYRQLSLACLNTPNEVLFISEHDRENVKKITDLVCLHNYDYNGYITLEKIENLIKYLNYEKK